jgi:hypothetical protein
MEESRRLERRGRGEHAEIAEKQRAEERSGDQPIDIILCDLRVRLCVLCVQILVSVIAVVPPASLPER